METNIHSGKPTLYLPSAQATKLYPNAVISKMRSSMSSAISFRKVRKKFPPATNALDDIDLEIMEGEFLVVVGPSGCGKSTLLRLVAGLDQPTQGDIEIFGKNAASLEPQDRDIGMVFQNYALFPHLSAFDNIAYGLKVRRESQPEIQKKVEAVARKLAIPELLNRKPHQLSGGQRQRVALARLLARDPRIHLFDEPLGNLDPQFRTGMRIELSRLHKENQRTTLYVTHDQTEAMTLGQRICVLRNGQILQIGSPEEIYEKPAHRFVAEFFGSPGTQCIDGKIEYSAHEGSRFISGKLSFNLPQSHLPQGSITLGVRPEDWEFVSPENASLNAVVKRVENLGDHRVLEVNAGNQNIYIKTSKSDIYVKDEISLSPLWSKVSWFERYTGKRI
jgi:sn-glycerol 3-phosphate transport system ATP-binding protein